MRPTRRRLLAILAVSPIVLTGCFAPSDQAGTSSSGGTDGGRLRMALAVPPAKGLSPYSNDATVLSKLSVVEGLTGLGADGTAQPALATEWKRTSPATWTFTLREANFQDGTPVTAKAVVTALDNAAAATPAPRVLSDVKLTAKATDERTVTLTTAQPDPVLPLRLASPALGIFAPKAYAKVGRVDPVGTGSGPFRLTRLDGQTKATLDRFDEHWGGKAALQGLDITWIPDGTARANALRSGDVDVAEWIPTSQAGLLEEATRHEVPSVRTDSLLLNTGGGLFTDPALRASVREAVDPKALVETVFAGYADAPVGLFGPAVDWAAKHRVEPTGRATALDAAQVKQKTAGKTVRLATYTNRAELPEAASLLQGQLEKAGFTVKQDVREYTQMESDLLEGQYDALVFSRVTLLDTGDAVAYLASDFVSSGSYNITQLDDKGVDAAIRAAAVADDTEQRRQLVMKAEATILGTDAVVPLVHEKVVQGISTKVTGLVLDPRERSLVNLQTALS